MSKNRWSESRAAGRMRSEKKKPFQQKKKKNPNCNIQADTVSTAALRADCEVPQKPGQIAQKKPKQILTFNFRNVWMWENKRCSFKDKIPIYVTYSVVKGYITIATYIYL